MARSSRWMAAELLSDFSRAPVLDSHRSFRTFCPSVHPRCWSCFAKGARSACACGSVSAVIISTPIRRTTSGCCARAVSGRATAAPPRRVMNARRFICRHRIEDYTACYPKWGIAVRRPVTAFRNAPGDSRNVGLWHKADLASRLRFVRFRG
jgi:hypothetical protein